MTGWSPAARVAAAAARKAKNAIRAKATVKAANKSAAASGSVGQPKQRTAAGKVKHTVVASQLKRAGDASYAKAGGTSKPHYRGGQVFGLATKVSTASLKETLHRVATGNPKSAYKAATIVTQKGSFQSSIGKGVFKGGSKASLSLNRGSIGKGFEMSKTTAFHIQAAAHAATKADKLYKSLTKVGYTAVAKAVRTKATAKPKAKG